MTGLLETYPLPWQDPRISGLRDALASAAYEPAEIIYYARAGGPVHVGRRPTGGVRCPSLRFRCDSTAIQGTAR